ncbi:hypothetical protein [Streptomyces sp. NRRL F-5135]|uniref:hypothetical protein n=1 Tax=Streptomyces sp. NRRL F-5135 TaxID=1463858 RepID=UPI00055ADC79|nr:hypothetical protein [Streptomyces sp. NRRL F-5135]
MRNRVTAAAVTSAALFITLTGCGGDDEASSAPKVAPPPYTVITEKKSSAELLVEDATTESATAAIHDWIGKNSADRKSLGVQVVRTKDAGTVVCRAEWYADEATAKVQTGGRVTADEWPHTEVACPDPGGS